MTSQQTTVFRAAVVGLGNIAWKFDAKSSVGSAQTHVGAYLNRRDIKLVGGCSPDANERAAFGKRFGAPTYETLEALISDERPHIVSICSPTSQHFKQARFCIQQQVPMLWLEKPPAESMSELNSLLEAQSINGDCTTILVNYQRRYCACYCGLRKVYSESPLGRCRQIHATYSRGLELNGSHVLDIVHYIMQDEDGHSVKVQGPDCANPSFAMSCANGTQVVICGIEVPYHCIDVTLTCDTGRASVVHGGMTVKVERAVEHELFPGFHRLRDSETDLLGTAGLESSMQAALSDLIAAHLEDRQPRSNLQTARRTQGLVELARGAA